MNPIQKVILSSNVLGQQMDHSSLSKGKAKTILLNKPQHHYELKAKAHQNGQKRDTNVKQKN